MNLKLKKNILIKIFEHCQKFIAWIKINLDNDAIAKKNKLDKKYFNRPFECFYFYFD